MDKRDRAELDKRLQDPKFEEMYIKLMFLKTQCFPDLVIGGATELSTKDLREGKHPLIAAIVNPGQTQEGIVCQANEFIHEATHLANLLSAYFPEESRWRWQKILLMQSLGGAGNISGKRLGGPMPVPEEEKLKIVLDWFRRRGRVKKSDYARLKGLDERTLLRWEQELRKKGLL